MSKLNSNELKTDEGTMTVGPKRLRKTAILEQLRKFIDAGKFTFRDQMEAMGYSKADMKKIFQEEFGDILEEITKGKEKDDQTEETSKDLEDISSESNSGNEKQDVKKITVENPISKRKQENCLDDKLSHKKAKLNKYFSDNKEVVLAQEKNVIRSKLQEYYFAIVLTIANINRSLTALPVSINEIISKKINKLLNTKPNVKGKYLEYCIQLVLLFGSKYQICYIKDLIAALEHNIAQVKTVLEEDSETLAKALQLFGKIEGVQADTKLKLYETRFLTRLFYVLKTKLESEEHERRKAGTSVCKRGVKVATFVIDQLSKEYKTSRTRTTGEIRKEMINLIALGKRFDVICETFGDSFLFLLPEFGIDQAGQPVGVKMETMVSFMSQEVFDLFLELVLVLFPNVKKLQKDSFNTLEKVGLWSFPQDVEKKLSIRNNLSDLEYWQLSCKMMRLMD
ncbi:hypothetical protein BJ508DRAFT_315659 [Ascobolus immersus RN42]|uniref:Uncharacterized protein n=1 Tax=Ascobolus immersus RN42 TaxID=1160509 RepID=A0A3N4HEN0_ASCIM|nr:hypothetical protein BJ508DRAFT_315659 [Ascobolus immersus RN42]